MRRACERAGGDEAPGAFLTLPFERRQRSRLRARLDDGREVGVVLARGAVLRSGDRLRADDGLVIEVRAAPEPVSTARASDPRALARACYHLGNRHLALQIGAGWVRYLRDHVIDEMVRGLGLEVAHEEAAFEPEAGAYAGGHAHHDHDHDHGNSHPHPHSHAHDDAPAERRR